MGTQHELHHRKLIHQDTQRDSPHDSLSHQPTKKKNKSKTNKNIYTPQQVAIMHEYQELHRVAREQTTTENAQSNESQHAPTRTTPIRTTHTTHRTLKRQTQNNPQPEHQPKEIRHLGCIGIVFNNAGINIHAEPNGKTISKLEANQKVLIIREVEGGWYQLSLMGGKIGYANKNHWRVYTQDPGANHHKVMPGQTAIGIAEKYYGAFVQNGQDLRYFVNALAHCNPKALKKPDSGNWETVAFDTATTIYVPGIQFAIGLKNKINDGSLTNGMYANIQTALGHVHDIVASVTESPKYIPEVLGELWEVIKEKKTEIIAMTVAFAMAEFAVGVLGAMPTGLTQVLAMLLQGLIVLFLGAGAIQSGIAAITEGAHWIKIAWNAKGNPEQLKEASKAYLRMQMQLALTVLAVLGARASGLKFKGLYTKYQAMGKLPKVASGVKEDPGQFLDTVKSSVLSIKQQELLARLLAKDALGRGLAEIGKREVSATDLAALTNVTRREFAIVILKNNQRVLVDTGSYKGGVLPINTKILLMHSHPTDHGSGMAKFVSSEDINALVYLKQLYSYIVTVDGSIYKFSAKTAPMSVGEIVRQPHPLFGWLNPKTR